MTRELSDYEMELLGILQEECAEVIQVISKIRRFGLESKNPFIENAKSNRELLQDEVGDFLGVLEMLLEADVKEELFDESQLRERVDYKKAKVPGYLKHQQ